MRSSAGDESDCVARVCQHSLFDGGNRLLLQARDGTMRGVGGGWGGGWGVLICVIL